MYFNSFIFFNKTALLLAFDTLFELIIIASLQIYVFKVILKAIVCIGLFLLLNK